MAQPASPITSNSPLIVTGMHRSGTSWVTRQLMRNGIFFGAHRDPNEEDYFFLRRNEWLLRQAGGAWDAPAPLLAHLSEQDNLSAVQERFARDVSSWRFGRFGGPWHSLRFGARAKPQGLWGWKDPRAVFTLPAWELAFPGARLLHLRRNGVDVAASLRHRERIRSSEQTPKVKQQPSPWRRRALACWRGYDFQAQHLFPNQPFSLAGAFELWEQYAAEGERCFKQFSGPKLSLSFEELASSDQDALKQLASFCLVADPSSFIANWSGQAQPERAAAYQSDRELHEFYMSVKDSTWMKAYGDSSLR